MKKVFLLALCCLFPVLCLAQAQLQTRKYKLSDFNTKVMKVVLSGNSRYDDALKTAVQDNWYLSPYEFSDLKEFSSLKKSTDFYFLMITNFQGLKESAPGTRALTIYKGGPKATDDLASLLEVVSIPLGAIESDGRDLLMMPALVFLLQEQTKTALKKEVLLFDKIHLTGNGNSSKWGKTIYICMSDLGFEPDESYVASLSKSGINIVGKDVIEDVLTSRPDDALVSYTIVPANPVKGSRCIKMLVDAYTYDLYYYDAQSVNPGKPFGFLRCDISHIACKNNK